MKKIAYLLMFAAALAFAGCNDTTLDEVYDELDQKVVVPYHKDVAYTLTTADYAAIATAARATATTKADSALAAAVATSNSLNSFATAEKFAPARLALVFPALNLNSTAQLTYAFTPDYVATLAGAQSYTLTAEDYAAAGATVEFFSPSTSAAASLPGVLATAYPAAAAGDVVIANFKAADQDAGASPTRLSEDFEGYSANAKIDQNGWSHINTSGAKFWQARQYSGNFYAQVTANGGAAEVTEAWMISPAVNLAPTSSNTLSFNICVGYWNSACLQVLISQDAVALTDPASATWDDVSNAFAIPTTPTSGYGTLSPAGELDLDAAYAGKTIYIAFKYNGETGMGNPNRTTTYQIDNVLVKGIAPGGGVEVIPAVQNAAYAFDGAAWAPYADASVLNPADYTAMGLTMLSAAQAPAYLPAYLAQRFPYAQEGDKQAVVYKRSATANAADEYVFTGGTWMPTTLGAPNTEQFVHNGTKWIFDPTVNIKMANADYQIMVNYVLNDPVLGVFNDGTAYNNTEWYYGFTSRYNNVNFRLSGSPTSSRDVASSKANDTQLHSLSTDQEKIDLLWKRLENDGMIKFLQLKYPLSPAEAQGVQLYYNITILVFYPDGVTNTSLDYTLRYKVLTAGTAGSPPTFEWVSTELQ